MIALLSLVMWSILVSEMGFILVVVRFRFRLGKADMLVRRRGSSLQNERFSPRP